MTIQSVDKGKDNKITTQWGFGCQGDVTFIVWVWLPERRSETESGVESAVSGPVNRDKWPTILTSFYIDSHIIQIRHHYHPLLAESIGVSGSFLRGGQQLHPAKIQSLPAEICSCQGGHVFSIHTTNKSELYNVENPDRKEVKVMPQIILYELKIIFSWSLLY